jgi:hypothetical protein
MSNKDIRVKFKKQTHKAMTKQEYLEAAEKRYDELQRLNLITDFYDYETEFVKIWQDLGREVLEKNISNPGNDNRKKKPHDSGLCNHK